ncbi:MAG: hypothetical protein A2Y12_11545 [Planctomycetes bacterium GWF2_42_9]|nr:MAG: hypothetical protein A2Y12_11545 [Planctomycetes bacterium GWF2_42_9]
MKNTEYKAARFDIANLLGWFECELQKESNTGSPIDARRELIRALALFSGISEKQIQESLEDLTHTQNDPHINETKNEGESK